MNINKTFIAATLATACFIPLTAYAVDTDKLKHDIKQAQGELATATKDTAITAQVKALFAAESDIPASKISVKTRDQIVYIRGWVDTVLQANKLIEIAQSVSGVKDINDSKLKTVSSANFLDDAYVTAKVKGKILQLFNEGKISKGHALHVETANGDVHIFGKVTNKNDIKEIEFASANVTDVNKVNTNIEVIKR